MRLNASDTQNELKVLLITVLIKYHIDTFTANTNNLASYEINGALHRRQKKCKFALKKQAPSIQHRKEHLSFQLLEIIQTILFMMI